MDGDGYYWCTHNLGMWLPAGALYPEEWQVVQIIGNEIWQCGADVSVGVDSVPAYVRLIGPLTPPT